MFDKGHVSNFHKVICYQEKTQLDIIIATPLQYSPLSAVGSVTCRSLSLSPPIGIPLQIARQLSSTARIIAVEKCLGESWLCQCPMTHVVILEVVTGVVSSCS